MRILPGGLIERSEMPHLANTNLKINHGPCNKVCDHIGCPSLAQHYIRIDGGNWVAYASLCSLCYQYLDLDKIPVTLLVEEMTLDDAIVASIMGN
jgi:hypothetical protein